MPELSLDRGLCIGSGMCVVYASSTFAQDVDAMVYLLDDSQDEADDIRTAVEACPSGALQLTSEQ